jgi:hypothetical protein
MAYRNYNELIPGGKLVSYSSSVIDPGIARKFWIQCDKHPEYARDFYVAEFASEGALYDVARRLLEQCPGCYPEVKTHFPEGAEL